MKKFLPLLILFMSCGNPAQSPSGTNSSDTNAAIPKEDSKAMNWQKLYSESEQETITFYQEHINEIDQKKYKALSAVQFINLLLSETEEGVIRTVLPADSKKMQLESGAQMVIVQDERIPDDSMAGEIRFFKLRNENSKWDLAEVSSVWKCYEGRGHTTYSTVPCL